jgi:predicted ATPase/DNA-binding SARP family transcriptional activator
VTAMRVALFGAFEVSGEGAPEAVRGAIPQAILARLALEPGRVFTADELVDALWAEPTAAVVSSLRAHISRLRSRGWGDVLMGGRAGYRLDLPHDAVDVVRYRALVAGEGGPSRADELDDAERLWRGAPLSGFGEFPFAPRAADELSALRRTALLELATLRLEAGDAAAAAAVIAPLSHHLDDEEVGALYARALDRSGRTADALATIDQRASALRDAGAGRSAALDALRLAIARQDEAEPDVLDRPVDRVGIPVPLTRFVGRETELETIRRGRAESRLVTLTGPAGVGKTRLAIEVARRARADEDERQRLIDLAVVSSPDRVVGAVADAVGASAHGIDAIADAVGGRRTLMILDNAEHVLGSTASLCARLLERCAGLSVLVTSRESMRMPGERVIAVDPLIGPGAGDAVALFLQRAGESSGIREWSEAELGAAERLCVQLDGLPLAIELAASRLDVLSLEELASSLAAAPHDDEAPDGGAPDDGRGPGARGGRHDSIDEAIAWSVRTTSASERALLAQLSEFSGSFTLEAVAGVCDAGDADPREVAAALARKSLVAAVAPTPGERRFRVLDTVKRHMRARHPLDDPEAWRRRHAAWMTDDAERRAPLLRTPENRRARAALTANRADLDDACLRLIAWGDRATAVRLVAALAWHWYERGSGQEAIATIERVLALPGAPAPDAEATALYAASFMQSVSGDVLAALRTMERFSIIAEEAEDPSLPMIACTMQATVAAHGEALELAEAQLAAAQRGGRGRPSPTTGCGPSSTTCTSGATRCG